MYEVMVQFRKERLQYRLTQKKNSNHHLIKFKNLFYTEVYSGMLAIKPCVFMTSYIDLMKIDENTNGTKYTRYIC